ncbi:MAG: hypothetical protein PUD20_04000 [bacterium]|nr:hypothetical protein [bacterium]
MNFIDGVCPHCQGKLQLPDDRQTVICMYCGKEIVIADSQQNTSDESVAVQPVAMDKVKEALHALVYDIDDPMEHFKRTTYMDFFNQYLYEHAAHLATLENAYLANPKDAAMLEEASESLISKIDEQLCATKARKREVLRMDMNLCMVVYVFPAILEYNTNSSKAWIEALTSTWKKHFPKSEIHPATAKEIDAGFKRRFCFISTAACEVLGKGDDCYELNLLRTFRDQYLLKSDDGEALVNEYYDIAPTIVKHINKLEDAGQIYEEIWAQYLTRCVQLIEKGENEACVALYQEMVWNLKEKYFYQ